MVRNGVLVKIDFDNSVVRSFFEDFNKMKVKKGVQMTKIIKRRYDQIEATESFYDLLTNGIGKPHRLYGNRDGCYAISISGNIRMIVQPVCEDLSMNSFKKCKKLIIKGVEDYHGEKVTSYIP